MYSDVTVILQSKPGKRLLVQSSSSSRARSKSLMNQTTFDVPDPLVVHVLLLTHKFYVGVIFASFLVISM